MKVIVIDVRDEKSTELAYVISESVYNHYCYHNFRAYEVILDDPEADRPKFSTVDDYQPEYLTIVLKPGREISSIRDDIKKQIDHIITIGER